ncbi:MAG: ribonuclease J [Holophagaceae bacterium]|nr:ribonuclease J [Holophagaceae bacterium]
MLRIPVTPFEGWELPPEPGELRLIPIGGLGEFGMNALVVHFGEELWLVDCGQLFPSEDQPGIDRIVPDFAYLEVFREQVRGVLLTHGHEDHIGALPHFLRQWDVPVYGSRFTMGLLEGKLREDKLWKGSRMHVVADFQRKELGPGFAAEWIPVTHSIPDACSIALHTPVGTVIHTGDFKLDPTPVDGRLTGLARLAALGEAGVRVLLSDSTNILAPGPTPSEAACVDGLSDAFDLTKGTLFVATFSSNIHRIQTLVDMAYAKGRQVVLLGRSLERNVTLARELGVFKLPDDILLKPADSSQYKPKELLVLCTGSQGEEQSGLARVLKGEVKGLKMKPGDRLLLSSRAIPGNEVSISRILDAAARLGAETTLEGIRTVHVTGHAHREDLATMMKTVKPAHMVPVHGTYRNLREHGKLAGTLGWPSERISLLDGGQCLRVFRDGRVALAGAVPVGKCYVDEGVEHMVDARIIQDRLILQEDGVIFATVLVDPETLDLSGEPSILSRGFVMLSDDEAYGELLRGVARQTWQEAPFAIRKDRDAMRELLRQALRRIIRKTTQTRPLVVPVILDAAGDASGDMPGS